MKKIWLIPVLLLVAAGLVMTSCNNDTTESPVNPGPIGPTKPTEPTSLDLFGLDGFDFDDDAEVESNDADGLKIKKDNLIGLEFKINFDSCDLTGYKTLEMAYSGIGDFEEDDVISLSILFEDENGKTIFEVEEVEKTIPASATSLTHVFTLGTAGSGSDVTKAASLTITCVSYTQADKTVLTSATDDMIITSLLLKK